ncbi:zeta toxin family protein [Moraxella catarrhalis]|uniref:zeta toxin family protein n=1 Tax=Moraxella catarrhalis TaxID=480 RepID=UPI0013D3E6D7|nr:zeta toxin family protein [Moraxella catarrhalis]
MSDYSVSEEELLRAFNKAWENTKSQRPEIQPVENPKGFVLGGQPAAGKSKSIGRIKSEHFGKNVLVVNGDKFRELHPHKAAIDAQYGEKSVDYTAQFSSKITQMMIEKAINERLNIIIEGTFRTAQTPINTLKQLKNANYQTGVMIATTDAQTSWQSALGRYEAMEKAGIPPRYTPKFNHDITVDNLAKNADIVYRSGLADTFVVNNREGKIWDNITNQGMPSQAINQELNKVKLSVLPSPYHEELKAFWQYIDEKPLNNQEKEHIYTLKREAMLEHSIQCKISALSSKTIRKNYPNISEKNAQKIELLVNSMLEQYATPQAQQEILEKIHSQLPDIASGKITLPDPPTNDIGKSKNQGQSR